MSLYGQRLHLPHHDMVKCRDRGHEVMIHKMKSGSVQSGRIWVSCQECDVYHFIEYKKFSATDYYAFQ